MPTQFRTSQMGTTLTAQARAIKFACANCGQHIEVPLEAEASRIDCPGCKQKVTIPKLGRAKLRINCPRCGQKLKVPPESAGTQIECPICTHNFPVPVISPRKPKLKLPRIPNLPKRVAFAVAAFVLSGALLAYWIVTTTPKYSLMKITKAIEQHDFATFQKHVDIDSVTTRLIDDMTLLGILNAEENEESLRNIGTGLIQLMKPRLVDEAKKQLCRFVEVGSFGETNKLVSPFETLKRSGSYIGVIRERREGKITALELGFTNKSERVFLTLEIKMRSIGGYWQVAELSNIPEFVGTARAAQHTNRLRRNAPIISKINEMVKVTGIKHYPSTDAVTSREYIIVQVGVRNTGNVAVNGYVAVIKPRQTPGKVRELRIRSSSQIEPSYIHTGTWKFDLDPLADEDAALKACVINPGDVEFLQLQIENHPELVIEE